MSTNFNDSVPSPPVGNTNVKWQTDGSGNDSAYIPTPVLTDLNTVITSLLPGDVLVWNGSDWVNALPGGVARNISYGYSFTAQSLSGSAVSTIDIDTVVSDTQGWLNTGTHQITPNVAGWYQVNGQIEIASSEAMVIFISKNGTQYAYGTDVSGTGFSVAALVYCNGTTDYITLQCYNRGGGVNTYVTSSLGAFNFLQVFGPM